MHPEDSPAKMDRSSKLPLSHQEKSLAELHETISVLTDRLSPVLTPAHNEPTRDPGDKAATPVQSPLADQLDANNNGIRKATKKLNGLMERLEC